MNSINKNKLMQCSIRIQHYVNSVNTIGKHSKLFSTASVPTAPVSSESSDGSASNYYEFYKSNHIPITSFQRFALTIGSSMVSLFNPARGDMIAVCGESSGQSALVYMKSKMVSNSEGASILRDKPRINSRTVDLEWLASLPENTLGKVYHKFLKKNKVTPDSRAPVQFVDDVELAYVMQRYREAHDLIHAVLFQPTNMLGEVTVKWIEAIQTRLPMCIGGALFGAMRLAPKQRKKYIEVNLPWAIKTGINSEFLMNIYFEKRWEQPVEEIYEEFKLVPIDDKRF